MTAHVQAQLAQGAVGFALVNPAVSSQLTAVQSRESSNPPQLVLVTNSAPSVSISAPASGAVFNAPASITVSANAADSDGTVTQVQFFANGSPIGTDTGAPYSVDWTNVAAGSYSLTAVATDNNGATTTSAAVPIVVNAPATVSLTSPANGATFTAPATITLTATAADSDGTIQKVEFFHGGTNLIATVTSAPYTFNWTNVAAASYSLTAKVTDNLNAVTTSDPVNITVNTSVAQMYFIHPDHLNTPRLIANQQGTTVWRWDQTDPFGGNVPDENPSGLGVFTCNLRLPGQYFDQETNLHYNMARDYDPGIGRYTQPDPLGIATTTAPTGTTSLSFNLYLYALGRPTSMFDPDGREVQTCCGMTSALPDPLVMVGLECMSTCLNATIYLSSGTRTPGQNIGTPGAAPTSQHLTGLAADVHIPPSKSKIRRAAAECGFFVLAKDYPKHVHVDLRNGINPKIEPDECVCQQIRSGP